MPSLSDILVVGGGPCGLATALFLAHYGISSTVLEKGEWPRDKVCGQGVMPCGVKLLQELGLAVDDAKGCEVQGIEVRSASGRVARTVFAKGELAWGVERRRLSDSLFRLALASKYISLRPRSRLVSLDCEAFGVMADIESNGKVSREFSPCVIGADGLRSTVGRLLAVPARKFPLPERLGVRQHFKVRPWSNFVEVEWHQGFELYATPVGKDVVAMAALTWPDRLPKGQTRLAELIKNSPVFSDKLRFASPLDAALVYGPLGVKRQQPVNQRCFLLGDAFCFWDGITGEGIATALVQGRLLARHLSTHGFSKTAFLKKQIGHTLRPYLLTTGLALRLSRHPTLRDAVFQLFEKYPTLFQSFIRLSGPADPAMTLLTPEPTLPGYHR